MLYLYCIYTLKAMSTESEFVYIFLQNLSKIQFYPDEAIIFIVFTYRKIALCHTAYVTGRAMECQEFRHCTKWSQNRTLTAKLTNF